MSLPRLYTELADWFHVLTSPAEYAEGAGIYRDAFQAHTRRPIATMLELGAGGGNNASHLKATYEMTLTDLSVDMLRQSDKINPECEHIQGDMRTLRLDRTFDAVLIHDAIAYMTTEEDLEAAIRTAAVHLAPGEMALLVPDETTELFDAPHDSGGHDDGDRSLRYELWSFPPKAGETFYQMAFTMTIREGDVERTEHDTHVVGIFPRDTWVRLIEAVGLEAIQLPYAHSDFTREHVMFVGIKSI